MTRTRGHYGSGSIDPSGKNSWRVRYRIEGKRYTKVVRGTKTEAAKELRRLLKSADDGVHVAPSKVTVETWVAHWLSVGAPGRRKRKVGQRTLERYAELLRVHVTPTLGREKLQGLQPSKIDQLYTHLEGKISARTAHHVHIVLNACMGAAVRVGTISSNPIARAEKVPSPGEADHGQALDQKQLRILVEGFKNSVLFPFVATLAFTGCRRNEALALRWSDLDVVNRTLRIERALEQSELGLSFKAPKTERGKRTIAIDDDLIALLVAERDKYLRLVAGVPDSAAVNLGLIKLPDDALMFPNLPSKGAALSLQEPRNPNNVTQLFINKASALGFKKLRLHDLRGTHETLLLDAGVPVHVVAARCGHDPAVLLRSYAKRTRKADTSAAAVIGVLTKGVLG